MNLKDILKKLVSFNTIKDKQNKEIMDFIENYLKKYHFKTKRIDKCLIAYNDSKPNIGFIGHTDTVNYESWDGNPFILQNDNDKLIGLGACDMKGGIAAILSSISKIDLKKNKIALYFTNDEETNFEGIKTIQKEISPNNIIIGEATDNIPIYATKGILGIELEFIGIKCHSSTPNKGINAIDECLDFIIELRKFYKETIQKKEKNIFDIPYTTMNVGIINSGENINSLPSKCTVSIEFRIANEEDITLITNEVNKLLQNYQCNITIKESIPPKINNNDINFLEKISNKKQTKCYITEGSFIDKNFIILGPGPDTSHQKNEFINYQSLQKTEELYIKIIEFYNKNH